MCSELIPIRIGMPWMPIPIRQNDADPTRSGSTTLVFRHPLAIIILPLYIIFSVFNLCFLSEHFCIFFSAASNSASKFALYDYDTHIEIRQITVLLIIFPLYSSRQHGSKKRKVFYKFVLDFHFASI
jgi:hypothetical protein